MNIIDYFKENPWAYSIPVGIVTIIGVYYTRIIYLKNRREDIKEFDQSLYNDKLKSKFSDLFEYDKSGELNTVALHTKGPDPAEISGFSSRVHDFNEKGNKFKSRKTNRRFKRLLKPIKQINKYTDDMGYTLGRVVDPDEIDKKMFDENKNLIEELKTKFIEFYRSVFGSI